MPHSLGELTCLARHFRQPLAEPPGHPQDQRFPPACPFPSVGAPTTHIKCALPCPALPYPMDGAAASTCKFASIYWLPLSLLPALELELIGGWAACLGGFSMGLPALCGPQDTGRCCLPACGSPACPSPGCWVQESHLPPAPGGVFTWLWEQVVVGAGRSEGVAGTDPLGRCAISC